MSVFNVVITGANRGIGLALAKQYLSDGAAVYALCRKASAELKKTNAIIVDQVDVTNMRSLESVKETLGNLNINVLINNAGIFAQDSFGSIDYESLIQQMKVNAIAPLQMTQMLSAGLSKGSKIVLITSRMASIADNGSGAYYGYRMSKAALNTAGKSLSVDLKPKGIAVAILHPGFVQTDMVNHAGDISADTAAQRLKARIDDLNIDNSGTFWHSNGSVLPW